MNIEHSFIDLHCHILPGIDDGPITMAESIEMCRVAHSDGIGTIVASPHVLSPLYPSPETGLLNGFRKSLKDRIGCDLEILPGADVHASPEIFGRLEESREGLTINGGRYMLLEFPVFSMGFLMKGFVSRLLDRGIVPIITHPERYFAVQENPCVLFELVQRGALVQITAMSITGEFGEGIKSIAFSLIRNDLVHIIASDGHDPEGRPPAISDAVSLVAEIVGGERARSMAVDYPKAVIGDVRIENLPPPVRPKRKRRRLFKTQEQVLAGLRRGDGQR